MANKLFSQEPELAVLSIVLRNPKLAFDLGNLRSFMFSATALSIIAAEIENLLQKQLVPDPELLINSLDASGNLTKVGGREYIEQIIGLDKYNSESLHEWVSFVISGYKARSFISTVSSIKPENMTLDNVEDSISTVRRTLDTLMESSGGTDTVHIGDSIKKALDEIVARTSAPGIRGYSWGISDIDVATGGKSAGDFWIIGGRPGQGKTALICNSILQDGKNGIPSLIFEREMNYQTMLERLVAIDTGISLQNIRLGVLSSEQIKLIASSLARIRQYPIFLDTSYNSDLYYLQSTISRYKKLHNVGVVYLDYLQILANRDDNQTQELGKISRLLKLSTLEHNICVIAASQFNRSLEARDNKRPMMSDLRQSGNLEEDAEYVIGLYRDEYYNKETKHKNIMEFIILKARNGPVGTLSLKFEPESNRILQLK
jgi:replicative DNA helicase